MPSFHSRPLAALLLGIVLPALASPLPTSEDESVRLTGDWIEFRLKASTPIELRAVDISGRQYGSPLSLTADATFHRLRNPWHRPGTPLWIRIHTPAGERVLGLPLSDRTSLFRNPSTEGMRQVLGGAFKMGSPADEPGRFDDEPLHTVTLTGFWIDTLETTRLRFRTLMGFDPSASGCTEDACPVENVSWNEAILFCNARSRAAGYDSAYAWSRIVRDSTGDIEELADLTLRPGSHGYRLPTEAQWEYAARGRRSTAWSWGSDTLPATANAWFTSNAEKHAHPVATKPPSDWGLRDMTGNVWEWTWDWYGAYDTLAPLDPVGPARGLSRTSRGGSWGTSLALLRCAFRNGSGPAHRDPQTGFRSVRPLP